MLCCTILWSTEDFEAMFFFLLVLFSLFAFEHCTVHGVLRSYLQFYVSCLQQPVFCIIHEWAQSVFTNLIVSFIVFYVLYIEWFFFRILYLKNYCFNLLYWQDYGAAIENLFRHKVNFRLYNTRYNWTEIIFL